MKKLETIKKVIINSGGIAKTADFVAEGLTNYDVANLCKDGHLVRIRHGYYRLAGQFIQEEQVIATTLPESVICVESALFYYGYSDFTPRQWSIAVPRNYSRTKLRIDSIPMKVYYIQPALFELGKTRGDFNGVQLTVYDRERTICDCFKYRTRLDKEMFNKALNAYAADDNKNLNNLTSYAKKMCVYKKLIEIMEVLLGG